MGDAPNRGFSITAAYFWVVPQYHAEYSICKSDSSLLLPLRCKKLSMKP